VELDIDYDLLAEKIAHVIAKAPREDEVLWDADECAEYLHCSRRHFVERISKQRGFPARSPAGPCWVKSAVVKYAKP